MEAQPQAERHISANSVHSGARLVRATSQLFTGGAGGLHHNHGTSATAAAPTENTPLQSATPTQNPQLRRQQSTTEMRAGPPTGDQVLQRMQADVMDTLTRNAKWLVVVAIVFLILIITMIVVSVMAVLAVMYNHDKPCDQPLKYYILVAFLWSQVPARIASAVTDDTWDLTSRLVLTLVLAIPGWAILGWGLYMVTSAVSCPKTNPELFYPTRTYIFFQIGFTAVFLIITTCMAIGARRFMLYVSHLADGPGCADAVRELPKVKGDSKDLVAEDGEVKGCPICMEELSNGAVLTPCTHYFHEECLATWCASHTDCPLCRQQVGEPDGKKTMTEP